MESGFLQNKKRERETVKTKATLSFIIYSRKGCTITSVTVYESHRPILVQCGRREPQDSVNSRSGESLEAILEAAYNTALTSFPSTWSLLKHGLSDCKVSLGLDFPNHTLMVQFKMFFCHLCSLKFAGWASFLPRVIPALVFWLHCTHDLTSPCYTSSTKIPWGLQAASVPWMNLP